MDICVMCVVQYGQKAKPGPSKHRISTDEAQRTKQNRNGGMDVCLLLELCVKKRSLRGADHLSRGVLPTVV
jgi:hypothetical protein